MVHWNGRFAALPPAAGVLRSEMAAIARACGFDEARAGDVKLATSEAVTNAIQHAYRNRDCGDVTGTAHIEPRTLRIVIADAGCGMTPRADSPGLGVGLVVIASLVDALEVISDHVGTQVHMTYLPTDRQRRGLTPLGFVEPERPMRLACALRRNATPDLGLAVVCHTCVPGRLPAARRAPAPAD